MFGRYGLRKNSTVSSLCSDNNFKLFFRREHIKECHGKYSKDGPNVCPHCKKTVTTLNLLKGHILDYHRGGGKCKDCDMVFKSKVRLRQHWTKERNLQCLCKNLPQS